MSKIEKERDPRQESYVLVDGEALTKHKSEFLRSELGEVDFVTSTPDAQLNSCVPFIINFTFSCMLSV